MRHRSMIALMLLIVTATTSLAGCRGTPPVVTQPATRPTASSPPNSGAGLPPGATLAGAPAALPTPTIILPTPLPRLDRPLIWCLRGRATPDLARINEALDRELALSRLNTRVEMRVIERSAYDRRLMAMAEAGEFCDLFSLTADRFAAEMQVSGLLPLSAYPDPQTGQAENLLETEAPGLWAALPPAGWDAVRREGVISAVPNPAVWVRPRGVTIRADVVRALGLEAELAKVETFAGLTPLFETIRASIATGSLVDPGVANGDQARRVFAQADLLNPEAAGYDPLALPFVIRYDDPGVALVNWFATPEFIQLAELRRDWQNAGFAPPGALTPDEMVAGYQDGEYLAAVGVPVYPRSAAERAARYGYEWIDRPLAPAFIPSAAPLASLTGVNARLAADPLRARRAVMLLDRLYTDPKILNLLLYGIEGEHWTWADKAKQVIRRLPGSRYEPDFADQLGGRALAYTLDSDTSSAWAAVDRANRESPPSAALGFAFDTRLAAGEVASLAGLTPEWLASLSAGTAPDVDAYARRMIKALGPAGLDALEAELSAQLEAWRNASIISWIDLELFSGGE